MSIHSIGNDLTPIERLREVHKRHGQKFLDRIFTEGEKAYCDGRKDRFMHYAGRFAAKEAVMKVLGTGWSQGVTWVDIEVVREENAAPSIRLHGPSAKLAAELGIDRVHISISHDGGLAMAFAVGESGLAD